MSVLSQPEGLSLNSRPVLSRLWRPSVNSLPVLSQPKGLSLNSHTVLSWLRRPSVNSLPVLSQPKGLSLNSCPVLSRLRRPSVKSLPVLSQPKGLSLNSVPVLSRLRRPSVNFLPVLSQPEGLSLNSRPVLSWLQRPLMNLLCSLPWSLRPYMLCLSLVSQFPLGPSLCHGSRIRFVIFRPLTIKGRSSIILTLTPHRELHITYGLHFPSFRIRIRMSFIGQLCLHIRGICYSDRSSTVQQKDSNRTGHRCKTLGEGRTHTHLNIMASTSLSSDFLP